LGRLGLGAKVVAHEIKELLAHVCRHRDVALSGRLNEICRGLVDAWEGNAGEVDPLSGALLDYWLL
jgi:hypothetical protein